MKQNIFLLSTDKPSRLFIIDKSKMFLSEPPYLSFSTVGGRVHKIEGDELYQPQNIYITNDEEIKEGDWYINNGHLLKCTEVKKRSSCRKIILTTDDQLIKDGVQSIDDEFLEWFVNNPSCEWVEVLYDYFQVDQNNPVLRGSTSLVKQHKIIIPREEPKQETPKQYPKTFKELFANTGIEPTTDENGNIQYNFKATIKEEPKQETVEEAAEKYDAQYIEYVYDAFIEGARWKAERMYSEEDMINFHKWAYQKNRIEESDKTTKELLKEWFEQFKKK